jgi:hypothetical protein
MLIFGPGADLASFAPYWTKQLGFTGDEPQQELNIRSLKSRQRYDENQNMHHEYATWSSQHGQFVVVYLGLNGTYQWNRPHFLDFLRSIHEK